MRALLLACLCGLGLLSCTATTGPDTGVVRGWRYAGLQSSDPEGEGQFTGIIAVGQKLFALSGKGELWKSESYSTGWRILALPGSGGMLYAMASDGRFLYLGTFAPGKIWKYDPTVNVFEDVGPSNTDSSDVFALTPFRTGLAASFTVKGGSEIRYYDGVKWNDWSTGYRGGTTYRMQAVGDTLWVATYDQDPWYRVWGDPNWTRLPAAKQTWGSGVLDTTWHPRGLAWHRGDMWIGWWGSEVSQLKGGALPYLAHRNCVERLPDGCKDIPLEIYSLLSYKNRLFTTGFWPASGFVLDDASGKFMPMQDGWCWDDLRECGGKHSWALAGLGDTIYAAANYRIMKFPLSDLPQPTAENKALWKWPADSVKTVP